MPPQKKFHWQPETASSLIFWSSALFLFFFSLIMALENAKPYPASILLTIVSLFILFLGWRRKIILDQSSLRITYARFWKRRTLSLANIRSIKQVNNHICIELSNEQFVCRMSKKNQLRFIEEWKKCESLKGEK